MKGILYGNFLLNRKWFLWAGIAAVFSTAACVILNFTLDKTPENTQLIGSMQIFTEIIVLALCEEWLGRNLENNIKCRFTDYTLAGGISKNTFVLSELLKNVITMVIGLAMCVAMDGVMSAFDSSFWSVGHIKLLIGAALLIGALDWVMLPLVIKLKSAEKAGLTVGMSMGFGIVMPTMIVYKMNSELDIMTSLLKLFGEDWFFPAFLGVCAALYAISYAVILHRVKWGDVC